MVTQNLSERDRIEIERSAAEAAKVVLAPVEVDRYLSPPADTQHSLEYAFYLLGDVQGKTVLDLGCGSGENMIPLLKRGAAVIGIDISPELIELARRRVSNYGLNARLLVGSAYDTTLPAESVDVVFSMSLLHHLDLSQARAEILRVLRPNGILILREPIRFSRTADRLRKLFPPPAADISDYEHPMTRDELSVVTQGFEILAQRNFRLPFVPLLIRFNVAKKQIWLLDRWLLSSFPGLEQFATIKAMSLRK